jgi:hypothetical protein
MIKIIDGCKKLLKIPHFIIEIRNKIARSCSRHVVRLQSPTPTVMHSGDIVDFILRNIDIDASCDAHMHRTMQNEIVYARDPHLLDFIAFVFDFFVSGPR